MFADEYVFSEADTTNWSFKVYTFRGVINDTIPTYHINNVTGKCNEALLRRTDSTMYEKKNKLCKN